MKDMQNTFDYRGVAIQRVGVQNVRLPFLIRTREGGQQSVLANICLTVRLPDKFRGTHMSRFIEVLHTWSNRVITGREIHFILREIAEKTEAKEAHLSIDFKYFIEKTAPCSGLKGMLDYDCSFSGSIEEQKGFDYVLGVEIPFTSLCPCSKEISINGAHSQRSKMRVKMRFVQPRKNWIEDFVELFESKGSSPIYPLLKREDEKYVTEAAYDNPKFVEDTVRDLVLTLREHQDISWFELECTNYESIHNHNAYAWHSEMKG